MKRVLTVLLLMGLALPAQAHTEAELEQWLETHHRLRESLPMVLAPGDVARVDVITIMDLALEDMVSRHPCSKVLGTWEEDRCRVVMAHVPERASAPSGGSASAPTADQGMGSNVEQWRSLVAAYFPAGEVDRALCIMSHESGGNPNAKNPRSSAAGLFQVMGFWWEHYGGDRYDPETNVKVARAVWDQQGWNGWSPYKRGLCR